MRANAICRMTEQREERSKSHGIGEMQRMYRNISTLLDY